MSLLNVKHEDTASAACSVAANRASKIRKLRASGLDAIAKSYWASLHRDIAEFICTTDADDALAARLLEIRDSALPGGDEA